MIDSINFKVFAPSKAEIDVLKNRRTTEYESNGTITTCGKIGDTSGLLHVSMSRHRDNLESYNSLSLNGSLQKYFLGSNLEEFFLYDVLSAIQKISVELHIPLLEILNAKVSRFDIGFNLTMDESPSNYLDALGEHNGCFKKDKFSTTGLYYKTHRENLTTYDKLIEMELREYKGSSNILRMEFKFLKELQDTFKREIIVKDLLDFDFQMQILVRFKEVYEGIEKKRVIVFKDDFVEGLGKKAMNKYAIQKLIIKEGKDDIFLKIRHGQKNKKIDKSSAAYLRKSITEVYNDDDFTQESPITTELNEKFYNAIERIKQQALECKEYNANFLNELEEEHAKSFQRVI